MSASSKRYQKAFPCMGGFCSSRDGCSHYHSKWRINPVERLCGAKEEPDPIKPPKEAA